MPEPFILLPDDLTYHKPNKTEHFIATSLATQAFFACNVIDHLSWLGTDAKHSEIVMLC